MTNPGRGAWSTVGKDNLSTSYVYLSRKPLDGHREANNAFLNINYEAVNLGVLAIQRRINTLGYTPTLLADGLLGPATNKGIYWVQDKLGVTVDSNVGPNTAKALWRQLIVKAETFSLLPHHILWGIVAHESLFDPGAVGAISPADRGLVQFNTALPGSPT